MVVLWDGPGTIVGYATWRRASALRVFSIFVGKSVISVEYGYKYRCFRIIGGMNL